MSRRSAESPGESARPSKLPKQISNPNQVQLEKGTTPLSDSISDEDFIPRLPVEVVAHVLRFMSLRERLNASLVCEEWYEASRFSLYSNNEKLVFRGFHENLETLMSFLFKTRRKFLNLEFQGCDLLSNFSNLLLIADKIHYLSFVNCMLSSTVKIELFTKCVNLYEFHCKSFRPNSNYFNRQIIETLEKRRVVNEKLKILRLPGFASDTDMTSHDIRSIFKVFPNIKQFAFVVNSPLQPNEYFFDIFIQEIISLKHKLEKLKILVTDPECQSLVPHNFTRLKDISICAFFDVPEYSIFDFVSRQQYLERISLNAISNTFTHSFPNRLFEHLILQCPHLKHLKLNFYLLCFIDVSPEMFRTLVSSKLISLQLINIDIRPTSDQLFTTPAYPLANKTLRVLCISELIDHRMQSLFIQSFKNLKFLKLECLSGAVLESIGQFQKNLTVLKLKLLSRVPSYYSESFIRPDAVWNMHQTEECLQSLTCLECLDLTFHDGSNLLNCKFIPVSVKYLRIALYNNFKFNKEADEQLLLPLKEKAALEVIEFQSDDNRMSCILFEICCSLKKLRLLKVPIEGPFFPEQVPVEYGTLMEICKRVRERCPSLRYLVQRIISERRLLAYDHVDQKIKTVFELDGFEYHGSFITVKIDNSKIKFYF